MSDVRAQGESGARRAEQSLHFVATRAAESEGAAGLAEDGIRKPSLSRVSRRLYAARGRGELSGPVGGLADSRRHAWGGVSGVGPLHCIALHCTGGPLGPLSLTHTDKTTRIPAATAGITVQGIAGRHPLGSP